MDKIELRKAKSLRGHPKNEEIFGDIQLEKELIETIKLSISKRGMQEPIIIKEDGTVLSGHIRLTAFLALLESKNTKGFCPAALSLIKSESVPVRVHPAFASESEEIDYIIFANIQRRHLSAIQRNSVYRFLKTLDEENPLTKGGRPSKTHQPKKSRIATFAEGEGVSIRTLVREDEVINHPLVTSEVKVRLELEQTTLPKVAAAINFANEEADRDGREPLATDVVAFLDNPITTERKEKKSYADLVKETKKKTEPKEPEAKKEPEPAKVPEPKKAEPAPPPKAAKEPEPPKAPPKAKEKESVPPPPPKEATLVPIGDRIAVARKNFEKLLGEADCSEKTNTELVALHTRLNGFLERLGLLTPKVTEGSSQGLPRGVEAQLSLFTSMVEEIEEVEDPMGVRDLLLNLSMVAKAAANRLTQTPKTLKKNDLFCPECFAPQVVTPLR